MKKVLSVLFGIIIVSTIFNGIFFFSENASGTVYVSGTISTNTIWTAGNSPYIVVDDVLVDNGTTLTIQPGVTVKFNGLYSLIVNGTLYANGTASQPIIFTSNQSTPTKGDWNRVRLHGKNNTMEYCEIYYGDYPLYIMGDNSNNTISNCIISNNTGDGIYLKKTTNNTINNTFVSLSHSNGITLLISENNIINNSYIVNNRAFGIYLRSSSDNTIVNTNVSNNKGGGIEFGLINHNIEIKNVTVFENEDNGIDLNGNNYINISNSQIIGNDGSGIDFGGPSEHQCIRNCIINNNGKSGIDLRKSNYVDIIDCNISRNRGDAGIYSEKKVENVNITNSNISVNLGDGIEIYEANFVNITNSTISGNILNGISFNGSEIQENNNIQNCTIAGNGNNGIYFFVESSSSTSFIQNNNISNNLIFSNLLNGIFFEGKLNLLFYNDYKSIIQYNNISNNSIFSNKKNGIHFKASQITHYNYFLSIQFNNIYNNNIYFNFQNGIYFDTYSNDDQSYIQYNNIHDNTIYSNSHNGICFYHKSDWAYLYFQHNLIYNNTINSNEKNGILFDTYYYQYSSNYYLYYQYNNIFSNIIYSNRLNGIFFNSSADYILFIINNKLFLNSIYLNGQNGIYFYSVIDEENFHIEYNDIYSNIIYLNIGNGIYINGYSRTGRIYNPYYHSSFIQHNNIYFNTIYSNNKNGINIHGNTRNGLLYLQNNMIFSNNIYSHIYGSGVFEQTANVTVSWQNSHIYNNTITSNLNGIKFIRIYSHIAYINNISNNSNDGIIIDSSNHNTFSYNRLSYNNWSGINFTSYSNNNKIQNNNISLNNQNGIFINSNSNDNIVTRNDIVNNSGDGVNITGSTDNYLHHNNFKYNARNAYDSTTQLNDWDDGAEGNWWTDYTGFDANNDGIGDIPYDVPGGGSKDWYPIIKPANITAPHVENTTPPDGAVNVSVTPTISVTFSLKMNRSVTESALSMSAGLTLQNFNWSNGDMTVTFEPSSTLSSTTTYTVTISVIAKDVLGSHLEIAYQFSFTTKDIIPPKIMLTSPSYNSIDIDLNATIVVTFSEPMNSTTVTFSCSPNPGGLNVVWSGGNSVATYSHNDFGSLTWITFQITGGKDFGGNDLIAGPVPNPWWFRTKDVIGPEITTTSPANGSTGVLLTANVVVTFNEQMNTSSVIYSCNPNPSGWAPVWSNGDRIVTYSHNPFTTQTTYTFQVTAGKDIAGNTLNPSVPNPWTFKTVDTVPPKISITSPINGSGGIPVTAQIIVTFNEEMDNTTVTFICNPDPGGCSVVWSGGNTVATYSHNQFTQDTKYTFQITGGKDTSGNNLVAGPVPNPWSFTTQDSTPPQILATTPIDGSIDIKLNANIVITFSEAMNPTSLTYTCSPDPGGWLVSWNVGNTIATYSHSLFSSTTTYSFRITSAKDLSGNSLIAGTTPNPFSFTTRDAIPPIIISTTPVNSSSNVPTTANVVVTFSEAMNTSTFTFTCSPNPSGWSVAWSAGGAVATLMHNPFERLTTYTLQITSCCDVVDNNLVSSSTPNPWSFSTVGNIPPTILSEPLETAIEKKLYTYDIEAFDSNNDILTYSLTSHPQGMTIDNVTGVISWIPTNDQVGPNPVVALVSDGNGGIDTQSFSITVVNTNDKPAITSEPITSATEDAKYTYDVEAEDIDVGDKLTFSLITHPLEMEIDSGTGVITWTPTNDQVGDNAVTVKVIDNHDGSATQAFTIIVMNENDPPIIISTPITSATEDKYYMYNVQAIDIDPTNDILTYSLTTYPGRMKIDTSTGTITWSPNNDQVGPNEVAVSVSDGRNGTNSQVFIIDVINVNDPPKIISTPITKATENKNYTYDVDAQDIDIGDSLTYSLEKYPIGMVIDINTGLITWTPGNDYVGVTSVTVKVIDSHGGTDKQPFTITIANVNNPPEITSIPVTSAVVGSVYYYDIDALDIDSTDDEITFSLTTFPTGMIIDPITGVITWTPTNDQKGSNYIEVVVSDGKGGSTTQSFIISVDTPPKPEREGTKKEGIEEMAIYSLILFISMLVIIFIISLFLLFKKEKRPPKQKTDDSLKGAQKDEKSYNSPKGPGRNSIADA